MLKTLSGRLLILTVLFVMVAEVLIFVPSIARFRQDFLLQRLERAQIASLALLGAEEMIAQEVEAELLANAGVKNVVLRRNEMRQLVLSSPMTLPIEKTVDLREISPFVLIRDALRRLAQPDAQVIRVLGQPVMGGGDMIEITLNTQELRDAMLVYGRNIFLLSLFISVVTGALLFVAVQRVMVMPIRALVRDMRRFAKAPEDARQLTHPSAQVAEIRAAEEALFELETQLMQSLKRRERLAQLGEAVAKISHDLRNILTTATLLGDRLERVDDPTVKRVAPKLVGALGRAVSLTEGTLAFGRAEERTPQLKPLDLYDLVEEVCLAEQLAVPEVQCAIRSDVPKGFQVVADNEHLLRCIGNLVRNAVQVIANTGHPGAVSISATQNDEGWIIAVSDTGPGIPARAQEHLFEAFKGSVRKGGTGLGLTIAHELIAAHGGTLRLAHTGEAGTCFEIILPKHRFSLD